MNLDSKLDDLFNRTNEAYMTNEVGPVTDIYVDMEYLQDMRIGALLHTVKVKKELEYIYAKLPDYNKRFDYECASYFPALKHTDEELDYLIHDKSSVDMVCFKAPFTTTYYEFASLLMLIQHHNRSVSGKPFIIHIHLNVDNPLYPDELLRAFESVFHNRMTNIQFDITKLPRYTLALNEYSCCKLLLIYNIEEFVREDTPTSVAFVSDGVFFNKKVFSVPYVNKDIIKDTEQYEEAMTSTHSQLNLFCDFFYIPSKIPKFNPRN